VLTTGAGVVVVLDVDDLLDDEHAASNTTVPTNTTNMARQRFTTYLPFRYQASLRPSPPEFTAVEQRKHRSALMDGRDVLQGIRANVAVSGACSRIASC
jgi:hypothetical protein